MISGIEPKSIVGRPAWIMPASFSGMPTSCAISTAISSPRSPSAPAIRPIHSARSGTGVCDQPSNAAARRA